MMTVGSGRLFLFNYEFTLTKNLGCVLHDLMEKLLNKHFSLQLKLFSSSLLSRHCNLIGLVSIRPPCLLAVVRSSCAVDLLLRRGSANCLTYKVMNSCFSFLHFLVLHVSILACPRERGIVLLRTYPTFCY